MEKEYLIHAYIQHQENASQWKINRATGKGLGTVNLPLNRLIDKDLVNLDLLPARSFHYLLITQGFKAKMAKNTQYIQRS